MTNKKPKTVKCGCAHAKKALDKLSPEIKKSVLSKKSPFCSACNDTGKIIK